MNGEGTAQRCAVVSNQGPISTRPKLPKHFTIQRLLELQIKEVFVCKVGYSFTSAREWRIINWRYRAAVIPRGNGYPVILLRRPFPVVLRCRSKQKVPLESAIGTVLRYSEDSYDGSTCSRWL
jgi:hypothetical protein